MAIPVTPAEFLANIPQTTQDPCEAMSNALLAYPQLVYDFMKWAVETNGSAFTQAFMNEIYPVGTFMMSANGSLDTGTATSRWLLCNGSQRSATDYAALATLLGTGGASVYGPASVGNIMLPDLRGKVPIGVAGSHALGSTGGSETVSLNLAQMPEHHHFTDVPYSDGGAGAVQTLNATSSAATVTLQSDDVGTGAAHENMPPYVTAGYWYIKT